MERRIQTHIKSILEKGSTKYEVQSRKYKVDSTGRKVQSYAIEVQNSRGIFQSFNRSIFQLKMYLVFAFLVLSFALSFSQTTISGEVLDVDNYPIKEVTVSVGNETTTTNANGVYEITIPNSQLDGIIKFKKEGYLSYSESLTFRKNQKKRLIVSLAYDEINADVEFDEVVFQSGESELEKATSISIDPNSARLNPTLTGGFGEILNTLPGVSTASELSSQYRVRGGNFDENLVYVNGVEIYRPQLVRSGEQEGLSFVNPSMVSTVSFSAGGWEAKYGDKLSSVLDIVYREPQKFELDANASLMGGGITVGTTTKNKKLSVLVGARYQNRNLILNTLDGETDYDIAYFDVQANVTYKFNRRLSLNLLSTVARNQFELIPENRETTFGSLDNPLRLNVFYDGREDDQFNSETAALNLNFKPTKKLNLSVGTYAVHTKEQEHYSITGAYFISEVDPLTGASQNTLDIGGQIDNARNDLDILIVGARHNGTYKFNPNNRIEWGLNYQQEDVRDWQNEWQLVDSLGFSRPSGVTLGNVNASDLQLRYSVNSRNDLTSNRASGYLQYIKKFRWNNAKVLLNAGVRATYWDYNEELNISPRLTVGLKPDWKRDVLFRFSSGLYYQPPFYREIRNLQGQLVPDAKSQQSIHFILGNDYEFKMFGRKKPFKLTTEIYYKILNDLNPYFVNNVRIRYTAANNSTGQAYGIDMRLNGEFVEGVESWLSLSYGKAEQNIDNRGNIPLPTDPRFKAAIFFQDYMDFLPSFKVNVNLVYASGLPNGAPEFTDPYDFQDYLSDYRRVDIGFVKELINQKELKPRKASFWRNVKELSIGLDIFNLFDIRNEISNSWIQDVNSNSVFAVPNRLTGRFFNAKLLLRI